MEVSVGTKVEVCSDEEGFGGAWFEGFVIGGNKSTAFMVQYEKFITDDVNGQPLVEDVLFRNMRPIPPFKEMPINCSPGFAVEALDTDCWWRGIIINKFLSPCSGEELFQIYFPDTRTIKTYPRSQLRPAQEWIRGKWRPLQYN